LHRKWSADEDEHLEQLVAEHDKNWKLIATHIQGRSVQQCQQRWRNNLRPQVKKSEWTRVEDQGKSEWTQEEDQEIWNRVLELGRKWTQISQLYLPSRTDIEIANRWRSIIWKAHAPGGRVWGLSEIEAQALLLTKQ